MAKKPKTVYMCQECGYESPQWMGQCICGAWNSFTEQKAVEVKTDDKRRRASTGSRNKVKPVPLKSVGSSEKDRLSSNIGELDRVLGGGIVKGSLVLVSGEPGIGKSTLIIQAAAKIAENGHKVIYISGEESEEQIRIRADRVCGELSDSLYILSETNMEIVEAVCESEKPDFLIIDSIQTMYSEDMESSPGSVSQIRYCGNLLMKMGKTADMPIFIVAHVTKSGELAGPKVLEHLVDAVLYFGGERNQEVRMMRAFKNRFGTTSEVGAFKMESEGLVEIDDLSGTFLEDGSSGAEGSCITAVYEGTRPVLFEVQALTVPAGAGFPRRTAVGIDSKRLNMILAVIEKKLRINMSNKDVYVNVAGGLRPDGTTSDLAIALAVYSSVKGKVSSGKLIAIGEIGLTGEVRRVQNADKIFAEAERMGFDRIMMPEKNMKQLRSKDKKGILSCVSTLEEAVKKF